MGQRDFVELGRRRVPKDLGDVDAVLPQSGISGSTLVAGPVLVVTTGNTATLTALNSAFGL